MTKIGIRRSQEIRQLPAYHHSEIVIDIECSNLAPQQVWHQPVVVIAKIDEIRTPHQLVDKPAHMGAVTLFSSDVLFVTDISDAGIPDGSYDRRSIIARSEEHTSELQSLMRISYAVFCLKKNNKQ